MENKLKVWIARDEDGKLCICFNHPLIKGVSSWWIPKSAIRIDSDLFPSVKWEDEGPTEAYITLAEPQKQPKQEQPQPKQEIDWEQRRYELTKDILIKSHFDKKNTLLYDSEIHSAISYANRIIEKLKKQNK